ncbi:MAG: TonB-dependent receptor, partial [Methylococcales bacterium]
FDAIPSVYDTSKYDQKVTKAPPASMGVVTADEIKKYGYRNFGEIISSLKGFYNTSDRNYGYVGARGFGIPGDYNTRLLLLIDGHRFNDNIYDSFDSSEGFPVDVDIIERVEVVRGPSSSMYGTSAFFGVINVITKRGRDQSGANIKASYGSNDAYKTSVSVGDRFQNGLEVFLSGSFYDNQGYNRLYYKEFDSPLTNHGVYEHNDEEQVKKLIATASYQDFKLQALFVRRNKDLPTAAFGGLFNHPAANTSDESTYIDLKYDHTFANQVNVQSRISYNDYRYRGDYPYDYAEPGSQQPFVVINKDLSRGQWWRAELNATKVFWDDHKITVGAEVQHNFDQYQTNYDLSTLLDSLQSTYKWALLAQDEYTISNQLSLNTGVRLDYFSNFGTTINPRAGLIYQPRTDTAVKLLYGSAFRAPNQFEQFYYSPTGGEPNPNLKPETLDTLELILEHYFNSHLRSELNLFYTEISDIIVLSSNSQGLLQNQNSGNVDSQGVELQLEDSWSNGFQARLSYSWQQTTNKKTHERITNSPEHMVKLNLIAPLWSDKVFLGYETQYMSSRKTTLAGKVSDRVINNVTIFTQKCLKGLELSAGAYNLFNERYFDPGADSHTQNRIQQDGLTFRVKASVDF